MDCPDFARQMDDYLDGRLDPALQGSAREHLAHCSSCRLKHQKAMALQRTLRSLPAPAPRRDFAVRALARASRPTASTGRPARRALLGAALAASLVLGVAVGAFFAMQPASSPVQTVTLTVAQPETVRLMFSSTNALAAATVSLTLPENVELVGYGNRRDLSWQTDLHEGRNLLQLPLVAHQPTKGRLTARVSHGGNSKTFQLKIEVKNAGRTGIAPAMHAT